MAKKKVAAKKRNPQDTTLRNARAARRREAKLRADMERDLQLLEARVQEQENRLALLDARLTKVEQPN